MKPQAIHDIQNKTYLTGDIRYRETWLKRLVLQVQMIEFNFYGEEVGKSWRDAKPDEIDQFRHMLRSPYIDTEMKVLMVDGLTGSVRLKESFFGRKLVLYVEQGNKYSARIVPAKRHHIHASLVQP